MICCAEQNIQLRPAGGNSGESSYCATTLAGYFIGVNKMKTCCTCKQIKIFSEFYKNRTTRDGYHSECKICCSKYQKKYHHTEQCKVAYKRYNQSKKGRVNQKLFRQTDKFKIATKLSHIRHPEHIKARAATTRAVISGKLPRPDTLQCSCSKQAEQYHHYLGYKPKHRLDVIPVCKKCHTIIEREQDASKPKGS